MTTLDSIADGKTDFVSSDAAALASHMNRCAHSRSRFFRLHTALESAHSVVTPRLVTVASLGVIFLVIFSIA